MVNVFNSEGEYVLFMIVVLFQYSLFVLHGHDGRKMLPQIIHYLCTSQWWTIWGYDFGVDILFCDGQIRLIEGSSIGWLVADLQNKVSNGPFPDKKIENHLKGPKIHYLFSVYAFFDIQLSILDLITWINQQFIPLV